MRGNGRMKASAAFLAAATAVVAAYAGPKESTGGRTPAGEDAVREVFCLAE